MKKVFVFITLPIVLLSACGPGNDAADVCNCYKEVYELKEEDKVEAKMQECVELLQKYQDKHTENGTLEEFTKALDKCR